jgi:hypothetical protein
MLQLVDIALAYFILFVSHTKSVGGQQCPRGIALDIAVMGQYRMGFGQNKIYLPVASVSSSVRFLILSLLFYFN